MITTTETQAAIGLCLLVAAADGEVSEEELAELKAKLEKQMTGDSSSELVIDAVIAQEKKALASDGSEVFLAKLCNRLPDDQREKALRDAVDVAFADFLDPEEEKWVRKIAEELGVDTKVVDEICGPPVDGAS